MGVLFLFYMFGRLHFPVFLTLFYYWPIFLIGAGIGLLFRKYPLVQTLVFFLEVVLFISLATYIGAGGEIGISSEPGRILTHQEVPILAEDTEIKVHYDALFVSGSMDVGELDFYRIETKDKKLVAGYDEDENRVNISSDLFDVMALPGARHTDVMLCDQIAWDVHLESAFSKLDVDLEKAQLISLHNEAAFSSTNIRLPDPEGTVPIVVENGFASTIIYVPVGTPVHISIGKGLSKVEYGYTNLKDGAFVANGYSQATDRYTILVDVGLGSVSFEEY